MLLAQSKSAHSTTRGGGTPHGADSGRAESIGAPSVLSTLNDDGSRRWIRPKVSPGRFLRARRWVAYLLILIFTLIPFLQIGGKPLVLLDVVARRFTIFGTTFFPTDTLLLALLLVGVFLAVILATALLGRVWCGWACPQTVYMEFVFRPIERLFEGSPGRTGRGILGWLPGARIIRLAVYLLLSLYLAHTFLSYFVGVDRLWEWMHRSPAEHPVGFLVVALVTALMMFDFAFFREQTCIVACPYGRFQSVMLDRDSLVIGYDRRRGEPRGRSAKPAPGLSLPVVQPGDCVDCHLCVTTCPTGIDIRNGLQMECIGCAQCIDACDAVMSKLGRSTGLIRYTSQTAVESGKRHLLRPRVVVYPLLLAAVAAAFLFVLLTRAPLNVTVLRGIGRPFSELPGQVIANPIRIKLVNRRDAQSTVSVEAVGAEGAALDVEGLPADLAPGEMRTFSGQLVADRAAFASGARTVVIQVRDSAGFVREVPYRMLGPASQSPRERNDEAHEAVHEDKDDHR